MNDNLKKKRAAAVAAVSAYIKTGEEALAMSSADMAPRPQTAWGISHRMDMMNLRTMMQMKAFQGAKIGR